MGILCLIYSIQDPLAESPQPRAPSTSPTSTTGASLSSQAFSSAISVALTITSHEPSTGTQNGSSIISSQRTPDQASPPEESHTPGANQRTSGRNNDWEMVDSDWERLGPDQESDQIRERKQPLQESTTDRLRETSFDVNEVIDNVMLRGAALQPPQQQPLIRLTTRKSASNTSIKSRQEARAPPNPYASPSHVEPPVPVPGVRASMLPPPRPPPSMPLPTRPGALVAPWLSPPRFLISHLVKWVCSHGGTSSILTYIKQNNAPTIMEPTPISGPHSPSNVFVSPTTSGSSSGSILPIQISTSAPPVQPSITGAGAVELAVIPTRIDEHQVIVTDWGLSMRSKKRRICLPLYMLRFFLPRLKAPGKAAIVRGAAVWLASRSENVQRLKCRLLYNRRNHLYQLLH